MVVHLCDFVLELAGWLDLGQICDCTRLAGSDGPNVPHNLAGRDSTAMADFVRDLQVSLIIVVDYLGVMDVDTAGVGEGDSVGESVLSGGTIGVVVVVLNASSPLP